MARAILAAAGVIAICVGLAWPQASTSPQPDQVQKSRPEASPSTAETEGEVFAETAKAFDEAYNSHDADAIANLFAETGEMIIDEGVIIGRDAIRAAFAETFAEFPEATIRTEIDSIRFPSPNVAIEEGHTVASRSADISTVEQPYVIVHARSGETWAIASVREEPRDIVTPAEALKPISWMVGDWIDESDDSTVETTCRWSGDGNWLIQDYQVQLHGGPTMSGTQRIGWDAAREEIRSWAFDSTGGFVEGVWSSDGEQWTAQVNGVAAEGAIGSGTRVITPLGPDAYLLQTFHRVLNGDALPDSEVTVVRRPPMVGAENPTAEGADATAPAIPSDAPDDSKSN
jgi:uncharacterized protein (TIGR02246 family)